MKQQLRLIAICVVTLLGVLIFTNPADLPSVVLIVPFLLLFSTIMLAIALILGFGSNRASSKNLSRGAVWAILPTLLLVLQSIGQLTLRDALTIVVLFAVAYFYVGKMRAETH